MIKRRIVVVVDDRWRVLIALMRTIKGIEGSNDPLIIAAFEDPIAASEAIPHMTDVVAIFTDGSMPGMHGTELATLVHTCAPVVLVTGDNLEGEPNHPAHTLKASGVIRKIIMKPADAEAVASILLQIMMERNSSLPTPAEPEEGEETKTEPPKGGGE